MFRKGQKVICVDDSVPSHVTPEVFKKEFPNWVKKDEKYTIRDIFDNDGIMTSVVVEELINPILFFPKTIGRTQEASFRYTRFREMEEDENEEVLIEELELKEDI